MLDTLEPNANMEATQFNIGDDPLTSMERRHSHSLVPPNSMGAGWYFIPLREENPIKARYESQRRVLDAMSEGKTLFEILGVSAEVDMPTAEDGRRDPGNPPEQPGEGGF